MKSKQCYLKRVTNQGGKLIAKMVFTLLLAINFAFSSAVVAAESYDLVILNGRS
jgi:hypothetical protein